jgi:hypothetical protein
VVWGDWGGDGACTAVRVHDNLGNALKVNRENLGGPRRLKFLLQTATGYVSIANKNM